MPRLLLAAAAAVDYHYYDACAIAHCRQMLLRHFDAAMPLRRHYWLIRYARER